MMNLDMPTLLSRILILIIAFTLHEFSHAASAFALGDTTAKDAGRLTLNPIAHLDFMGTLLLIFAGFGWAKPVPINPYVLRRRNKAGVLLVSIAGPLSNLLLAVLAALPLRFGWVSSAWSTSRFFPTFSEFLLEFVVINITLFLFNLIPLAPLDGEKVLDFFLPHSWQNVYDQIKVYGPWLLLIIAVIGPRIGFDLIGIIVREPMIKLTRFFLGWN